MLCGDIEGKDWKGVFWECWFLMLFFKGDLCVFYILGLELCGIVFCRLDCFFEKREFCGNLDGKLWYLLFKYVLIFGEKKKREDFEISIDL